MVSAKRDSILQCCQNSLDLSGNWTIFNECPTKNVKVSDQMSDRKYKNIHLVDEKKRNTSDHKGQQLGFRLSSCFCRQL